MKIGIIGAMQVEVDSLVAAMVRYTPSAHSPTMKDAAQSVVGGVTFYEGTLCGVPVVVARSGVGKVNGALCAHTMCLKFGVTHVVNTGIAGAMAAGLGVADFVVSTDAMYYDVDAHGFGYPVGVIPQMECSDFHADAALIEAVEKAFGKLDTASIASDLYSCPDSEPLTDRAVSFKPPRLVQGRIATGDQFVSDRAVKERIKAVCAPACVEMEGAAIAHACYLDQVPFVIIRCMSDQADEGEEATYSFNEKICAAMSAQLVMKVLEGMKG